MADKILGVVCFALCGASQAFIRHSDTALFFGFLYFALGSYEFILGALRDPWLRGTVHSAKPSSEAGA